VRRLLAAALAATLLAPAAAAAAAPRLEAPGPLAAALEAPVAAQALPPDVQAVVAAANALPEIRVYFANEPGLGHQSASLAAMRRLRDLGYEGRLEAVYDGDAGELAAKVATLLPDPAALGATVETTASLLRRNAPPVDLALSGGDDAAGPGRLTRLRALRYLRLSPANWIAGDELWELGRSGPRALGTDGATLFRPGGPAEAEAAVSALERGFGAEAKAAGLRSLLRALPAHDLLPIYGLAFMTSQSLHDVLLGAALARRERPDLFGGRGLVAPLLLPAGGKLAEALRTADPRLSAAVLRARVEDPGLEETLARLKPGQLLALETGPVPPAVFERLFAAATLPPVLEGKNAASLAGLLGLPFLPVRAAATLDFMCRVLREDAHRAGDASELLGMTRSGSSSKELLDVLAMNAPEIAGLIVRAADPASPLRRLFADFRQRQDDFGRDKLVRGLKAAFSR